MTARTTVGVVCAAGVGVTMLTQTAPAAAEDLIWDAAKSLGAVSVRDRPRTAYEPDGIRVGNFLLLPEIGYGTVWTSYGGPGASGQLQDFRHELTTSLDIRSQTPRHHLDVKLGGRAVQYQEQDDIRYIDGGASASWRVDIDHAHALFGSASTALAHDENVDADLPKGIKKPPTFLKSTAELGLQRSGGRIDAAVGARYARIDYDNAELNDGSIADLSARNYSILSPFVQLGMRLSPGYRVFAEVAGQFQENRGTADIDRDARGVAASAGTHFELSPLVKVMLRAGFVHQDNLQSGLQDLTEPTWEGRLEWLVTPLVTLSLATRREMRTATYGTAVGQIVTTHALKAEYEMWRNLIVTAQASIGNASYIGDHRDDTIWSGAVSVEYMHSKNWFLGLSYEHQELMSSEAEYDRRLDRVGVNVKYRF